LSFGGVEEAKAPLEVLVFEAVMPEKEGGS
jgi:hypothetical protein